MDGVSHIDSSSSKTSSSTSCFDVFKAGLSSSESEIFPVLFQVPERQECLWAAYESQAHNEIFMK